MKKQKKGFVMREFSVLIMIAIIYVLVCFVRPSFFSKNAIINIFLFFPYLLLLALGEMTEILSRNVDVSLGSILAFSGYIAGLLMRECEGIPLIVLFIVAIAVGAVLGLINGVIVTKFAIPSIIVTLGTCSIYRGVIFMMGGKQIDNYVIPRELIMLSQPKHSVIGVPYTVIIVLIVAVLVAFFLKKSRLGRKIYVTGCNPAAAKLRGVNLSRINILVFVIAGALAGFAGMIFISRIGYLDPGQAGKGLEFTAIAAVVIGGTSMNGGVGTTLGTVFGCLLLGVINNAIPILGISGYWQEAIYGFIIVGSVVVDNILKKRMQKTAANRG